MFSRFGGKRKSSGSSSPIRLPSSLYNEFVPSLPTTDENTEGIEYSEETCLLEEPLSDRIVIPSYKINGVLSEEFKYCNGKVWIDLLSEFKNNSHSPVLVWGPTGCGKTCGVKKISDICGLRVYEIEPSVLESTDVLYKWLISITQSKTLLGPRVILIDCVEGIDSTYISVFEKFLKKYSTFSVPIVFIADDAYKINLRSLFTLIKKKLKCFRPNIYGCVDFAKNTFAKHKTRDYIETHAKFCNGDIRNLKRRILNDGINTFFENGDDSLSLFESTNNFLIGKLPFYKWIQCSTAASLTKIIFDNYLSFLSDIDSASILVDDFVNSGSSSFNTFIDKNLSENTSSSSSLLRIPTFSEVLKSKAKHVSTDLFCQTRNDKSSILSSLFSEIDDDFKDYNLITVALRLKQLCDFTQAPKMTLYSTTHHTDRKSISNVSEYHASFSHLHIPELLRVDETYDIGKSHI
tara:strand:- start:3661 stop:5049 length:1389 start_codon:yes stop_codon:yes gene_type:complete